MDSACVCRGERSIASARSRGRVRCFVRCLAPAPLNVSKSSQSRSPALLWPRQPPTARMRTLRPLAAWDRFSFGVRTSLSATARSASSVSVGCSLGSSVSSGTTFCSTAGADATVASLSGPGGRSVGSLRVASSSSPTSIAGAPNASSLSADDRAKASATQPACSAIAQAAAITHRRELSPFANSSLAIGSGSPTVGDRCRV